LAILFREGAVFVVVVFSSRASVELPGHTGALISVMKVEEVKLSCKSRLDGTVINQSSVVDVDIMRTPVVGVALNDDT
jgi:hypothetical protein